MRFFAVIAAIVAVTQVSEVAAVEKRGKPKNISKGAKERRDIKHYMDAKSSRCKKAMESESDESPHEKPKAPETAPRVSTAPEINPAVAKPAAVKPSAFAEAEESSSSDSA